MNLELDNALCRDFPLLYKDRSGSMQNTCMCWGFEVPDHWEPVIRELSAKLESMIVAYVAQNPDDEYPPKAAQVKEKWGGLRFYMSGGTDEMHEATIDAERAVEALEKTRRDSK